MSERERERAKPGRRYLFPHRELGENVKRKQRVEMMLLAMALSTAVSSPTRAIGAGTPFATTDRRAALRLACAALVSRPLASFAAADCMQTCKKNCNRNAPGSSSYCESSCAEYCGQDDRRDGLSGSVSTEGSEFGWTSSFKNPLAEQKPVVYGDDLPPGLPDLFGVKNALRKAVSGGDLTGGVQGQGGARDFSDVNPADRLVPSFKGTAK